MVRLIFLCGLSLCSSLVRAQETLGDPHRNVYDVAVSDSLLYLVTDHAIEIWKVKSRQLVKTIQNNGTDIFSSIALANEYMVTGTRAGEVALWNIATSAKIILLQAGQQGAVTALDVNPVKALVAVGFASNKLSVYSTVSLSEVVSYANYGDDVTAVQFTHDNNALICGSGDGSVEIHDLETRATKVLVEKSKRWVNAIAVSYDSSRMAIATDPDQLMLYATFDHSKNYKLFAEDRTALDWVTCLDYARNNSQSIATGTLGGKILIRTPFGVYKKKVNTIVNQLRFVPQQGKYMTLALATNGKGLLLLEAINMKYSQ